MNRNTNRVFFGFLVFLSLPLITFAGTLNCATAQSDEAKRYEQAQLPLRLERDDARNQENIKLKECEKFNPNAEKVLACTKDAQETYRLADIEIKKKESDELTKDQNNLLQINLQCRPAEPCNDCVSCNSVKAKSQYDQDLLQTQIDRNYSRNEERKAELDCSKLNPDSAALVDCTKAASEAARLREIDIDERVATINNLHQKDLSTIAANCAEEAKNNPPNHPSQWSDSYGEIHDWEDRFIYTDKYGKKWAFPLTTRTFGHSYEGYIGVWKLDPGRFVTDHMGNPVGCYTAESSSACEPRYGTPVH